MRRSAAVSSAGTHRSVPGTGAIRRGGFSGREAAPRGRLRCGRRASSPRASIPSSGAIIPVLPFSARNSPLSSAWRLWGSGGRLPGHASIPEREHLLGGSNRRQWNGSKPEKSMFTTFEVNDRAAVRKREGKWVFIRWEEKGEGKRVEIII